MSEIKVFFLIFLISQSEFVVKFSQHFYAPLNIKYVEFFVLRVPEFHILVFIDGLFQIFLFFIVCSGFSDYQNEKER